MAVLLLLLPGTRVHGVSDDILWARGASAAFDYENGVIYLARDATRFEWLHESAHARQWLEIGRDSYKAPSRYERELYVFRSLERQSHLLNRYEFEAARNHIRRLAVSNGYPVPF